MTQAKQELGLPQSKDTYYPEPWKLAELLEAVAESEVEKAQGFRVTHEQIKQRIADRVAAHRLQREDERRQVSA